MKTPQPINIYGAVVNPRSLNKGYVAERPQPKKWHLIHICQAVVHPGDGSPFREIDYCHGLPAGGRLEIDRWRHRGAAPT